MSEEARTPEEEPTGVWALVLALFMLGPLGALALIYGLDDFWQKPGLNTFFVPYIGAWLLYTCAVILYNLATHTSDDKVRFPKRAPKTVLVLNLVVFAPFVIAMEFGSSNPEGALWGSLSWELIGTIVLFGIPFLAFIWSVKAIFWGSLSQLVSPNDEDGPAT